MPTEEQTLPEQGTTPEETTPIEKPQVDNTHMIPKTRFDEINTKNKQLQAELDVFRQTQLEQAEQAKIKQGEFETLYGETKSKFEQTQAEYEATKSRAEQLESVVGTLLEQKLQEIPEEFHELIPENLSVENKLQWIATAKSKGLFGTKQDKSQQPLGQPTNQPTEQKVDVSKMSVGELLRAAYGSKK